MLVPILLFLLGFVMLIKGGDWFVDGAVGIAHRFHLPELLIGATVVSIGTTLPEVMVSAQAAMQGNAGISYGNAIGSVICNTSLIAALTVAVRPGAVNKKALFFPVAAFFAAAAIYAGFAYTAGQFYRWNGVLFLLLFAAYMVVTVLHMKRNPESAPEAEPEAEEKPKQLWQELLLLVLGAAVIAVGANLLVNNGTLIAAALGVPDSVIGLTMVALGTSLPELITAITISPFSVPASKLIGGMNASLLVDVPVMLLVMAILCLPTLRKGKLQRWQGILLLGIYVAFTVFQFVS